MKILLGLLFFITADVNAIQLDRQVFSEKYQNLQMFQKELLGSLRNYFSLLPTNSIQTYDSAGIYVFKVLKKNSPYFYHFDTVFAKIERKRISGVLTEQLYYHLDNGQGVSFKITKTGPKTVYSTDQELLGLNFKPTSADETYVVEIPELSISISSDYRMKKEIESISLGNAGFELRIESSYSESKARRDYIFYSNLMKIPQVALSVSATFNEDSWEKIQFKHFKSNTGSITPALFSQGISQASSLYVEQSVESQKILEGMGFPILN